MTGPCLSTPSSLSKTCGQSLVHLRGTAQTHKNEADTQACTHMNGYLMMLLMTGADKGLLLSFTYREARRPK